MKDPCWAAVATIIVVLTITTSSSCLTTAFSTQYSQNAQVTRRNIVSARASRASHSTGTSSTRLRNSFFKGLTDAFANDSNLSSDKSLGQYDAPGEEYIETDPTAPDNQLTEVQRKWQAMNNSPNSDNKAGGAGGVSEDLFCLPHNANAWLLDVYLSGVPTRDPSNDLYGSRVNISNRDKETGLDLPEQPTITLPIQFATNGKLQVEETDFTPPPRIDSPSQWKLSSTTTSTSVVRLGLECLGYTRTVETKGSIQNVFWSKEDEASIQTSSSYNIPPGMIYVELDVSVTQANILQLSAEGVLRLEQTAGLFGVSSKLVPCGKVFSRRRKT